MANPPITIGPFTTTPAPGSPIASAWAQQVSTIVTSLLESRLSYADTAGPGGGANAGGSGTPSVWQATSLTAPSWATKAVFEVSVTGHFATAAAGNTWDGAVRVNGISGGGFRFADDGIDKRLSTLTMSALVVATPSAANLIEVMVSRVAGTGAIRADAGTRFSWKAHWLR